MDPIAPDSEGAILQLERQPVNRRLHLVTFLVTLAAASILIFFSLDPNRGGGSIEPIPMGEEALECRAPMGANADFAVFQWVNGESGGSYDVVVYGSDGDELDGGQSGSRGDVRSWRPDPEKVKHWGDAIEWQLRWLPAGGGAARFTYGAATR